MSLKSALVFTVLTTFLSTTAFAQGISETSNDKSTTATTHAAEKGTDGSAAGIHAHTAASTWNKLSFPSL